MRGLPGQQGPRTRRACLLRRGNHRVWRVWPWNELLASFWPHPSSWPCWSPSFFKFTVPTARKSQVVRRGLPGLLDEPVKDQNAALLHAEQDASDPVARQRRTHLPQAVAQRAAKRHAHRPAILDTHEVDAYGLAVGVVQAP